MASTNNDHLLTLFAAVLGGSAEPEQVRQLDELLAADPRVVEMFVLFSQQEVDLRHVLKTACVRTPNGTTSMPAAAALGNNATRHSSRVTQVIRRAMPLLATAAVLVVVIAAIRHKVLQNPVASWSEGQPSAPNLEIMPVVTKPPAPVAVLAGENGAVWQGPHIFLGQSLREGDALTLISGEARISMGFGAEIAAKGPCALRIVARDRVQLEFGEVAVHVAPWAHGFVVETPTMDVVDLGTTFVVSASRNEGAEASVIKGQVRVSPRQVVDGSPNTILVSEGESLLVERTGQRKTLPSKPKGAVDFGSEHPYRPIGLHNSGYGLDAGDEDPHWRVSAGPQDSSFSGPQFATVCVPDPRYMPNDRESSQWVSMAKWREATPHATYTFETKFDLTGFDLTTVQLFGRFLADNGINEVRVNGEPVILESWVDNVRGQHFSLPQFRTVNVTSGLVQGINTIEIDVWNDRAQTATATSTKPNPMALRVEWEGFGRPSSSSTKSRSNLPQRLPLKQEKLNKSPMSADMGQKHYPT